MGTPAKTFERAAGKSRSTSAYKRSQQHAHRKFNFLCWILAAVMFMYLSLVIVPEAKAGPSPRAELILEIADERLRIFEYETERMLCHISVVDVKMIGSQITNTCVLKEKPKNDRTLSPRGDR